MKVKSVDEKLEHILKVIIDSLQENLDAAQDAQNFVLKIQASAESIQSDLDTEKITKEEASLRIADKDGVAPLIRRMENRIKRLGKNTKAIQSMLNAVKSLHEPEKDE